MSGGRFEYIQYRLSDGVIDEIEKEIQQNGKPKTKEELREESWRSNEWYERYPEDLTHYEYPEEIIQEFKKGIEIIKKAQIYIHRIDWLLSGDDGEDSFIKKLKEDLNKIDKDNFP
jgi:hypothetical protein